MKPDRPLPLGAMLLRQGANFVELGSLQGREFARAMRRCMSCSAPARCSAWLAGRDREGYDAFCPNAGFIEELRRIRL